MRYQISQAVNTHGTILTILSIFYYQNSGGYIYLFSFYGTLCNVQKVPVTGKVYLDPTYKINRIVIFSQYESPNYLFLSVS